MSRKILKLIAELIIIIAVIMIISAIILMIEGVSVAEAEAEEGYVLCSDYVNIRSAPSKKGEPIGRFEIGERIWLDGKQKNGFLHCVNLSLENTEGWIHKGYVVWDEPIRVNQKATVTSKGRLAARKYVGGKRTRWLKPMASVKVYYWSDEWCVTNCGYVQTKYLELEGE